MKKIITVKRENRINTQSVNVKSWRENAEKAYHDAMELSKSVRKIVVDGVTMGTVHVTIPSIDHKLAGLQGINTSVTNNPVCIARREKALKEGDFTCVCLYCYADNLMACYRGAERLALYNQFLLTSRLLSAQEIKAIALYYNALVRFEMFGDVSNLVQAENYVRIACIRDDCAFGAWSKNTGLYVAAFEKYGKPSNMSFVKSSVHLNVVDEVTEKERPYVDVVFTVCDDKDVYHAMIEKYNGVACAGVSCMACRACYDARVDHDGVTYVFELLR